jgi:hypothetical protein
MRISQCRVPALVQEDRRTNVGVVDLRQEAYFGRSHGVVLRQEQF